MRQEMGKVHIIIMCFFRKSYLFSSISSDVGSMRATYNTCIRHWWTKREMQKESENERQCKMNELCVRPFAWNESFVIAVGQFIACVNRINTKIEVNPEVIFLNQPTQSETVWEKALRRKQKKEPKIVKRSDDSFLPCWKWWTYGAWAWT